MSSSPRIFISTGELSGDFHASNLVKEIQKLAPDTVFMGVGSHNLKSAGVEILYDSSNWGSIGIWEGVKRSPAINRIRRELIEIIPGLNIDLLIVVDYRVFHASLLKALKNSDFAKLYYFAPIVWPGFETHSLGKKYSQFLSNLKHTIPFLGKDTKNRFEALSELADKLLTAYPFSLDEYLKAGGDAEFIGHPLMNVVKASKTAGEVRKEIGISETTKLIGIIPGSRNHELKAHLPVLNKTIKELKRKIGDVHFYMPIAHPNFKSIIQKLMGDEFADIRFVNGDDYDLFSASDLAISKTGTSVQILMGLGVPTIAFYTLVSRLWYNISIRYLVRFKYAAFPNVMAGREIIPEFIQDNFTSDNLIRKSLEILSDESLGNRIRKDLLDVRNELYREDALQKAAEIALELARRTNTNS